MVSSHDCGWQIKDALESQRSFRTNRRGRKTRYRSPRFDNRSKPEGWLPPSLMSRIYNIETWFNRLRQRCLITSVSIETVRFDTQKMENPEISGVEYQQGELEGYEVREKRGITTQKPSRPPASSGERNGTLGSTARKWSSPTCSAYRSLGFMIPE